MSSLTRHSASSVALPSRMGASTGGIAVGSPHNYKPVTLFSLGKIPPASTGSTDSSKQRLQGLCSTTGTFLPPTERSNRGNTAVGSRTRVLSRDFLVPKRDGGLRPILDLRRLNFSLYKGKFKMLTMKTIMSQVQEGDWLSPSTWRIVFSHPGRSKTQEVPSVCLWREGLPIQGPALWPGFGAENVTKCMDAALAPLRLQGIRVLNYPGRLAHSGSLQGASESVTGISFSATSILLASGWTPRRVCSSHLSEPCF